MGIPYDEISISTKREINLCERAIRKLKKDLADKERTCQRTTHESIEGFGNGDRGRADDALCWDSRYKALKDWEKRLNELREILNIYSHERG